VKYLPTPNATDGKGSAGTQGRERSGRSRKAGDANLPEALALLRTPTAQLAANGGSQHPDKRKAGGHGPTLADQVEHLLPTPRATDGTKWGPGQTSTGGGSLPSAVTLLPTPDATHGRKTTRTSVLLPGVVEQLLPTPTARLGDDSSRSADPARYKGPKSLNGRRSNLDDCIAAVETQAAWLGESTSPPSADGKPSSDGQPPGQLSLDGLESD
jgi:hypothetical protein